MKKRTIVAVSIVSLFVIGGISEAVSGANAVKAGGQASSSAPSTPTKADTTPVAAPKPAKSQADQIRTCMGVSTVKQVTYTAAMGMASADVYTTINGTMFGDGANKGRLIVAVYNSGGAMLANGNF
jgi:hypothetical protein